MKNELSENNVYIKPTRKWINKNEFICVQFGEKLYIEIFDVTRKKNGKIIELRLKENFKFLKKKQKKRKETKCPDVSCNYFVKTQTPKLIYIYDYI